MSPSSVFRVRIVTQRLGTILVIAGCWLAAGLLLSTGEPVDARAATSHHSEWPPSEVRHFGAKGNGTTDDTEAIQATINAAPPSSGRVHLSPGSYRYRKLVIRGKTNLIVAGDHASLVEMTDDGGVAVVSSPGLTMTGLTFDHASHNGYMVDITSSDAIIERNTFKNLGDGICNEVEAAVYIAPGSDNTRLEENSFLNLRSGLAGTVRGVYINNFRYKSSATYNARILNNRFDTLTPSVDADGVVIDQQGFSSRALIAGNTFYNCSKRAVKLMSNDNLVRDNTITVNGLKTQSYSAVSSYGDGNRIIHNRATAQGCARGCSFYCAWELSGSNNVLSDNAAENPAATTDRDIDCVSIVRPEKYKRLDNITISGNTCRTFRYVRLKANSPAANVLITGNKLLRPIAESAIVIYSGSPVDGLSLSGNATNSGKVLIAFFASGAAGKSNFDIGVNTGAIDLNLGDDPVPTSLTVESTLVAQNSITIYSIHRGRKLARGSAPPNGGYWRAGDIVYDAESTGWACTVAGVPGKWRRFGL